MPEKKCNQEKIIKKFKTKRVMGIGVWFFDVPCFGVPQDVLGMDLGSQLENGKKKKPR